MYEKGLIIINPVIKNKEYILDITALTNEGSGIARHEGFAVFVPQTVPGDRVRALILKVKTSYAYAKALEIITPSPDRIEPECKHFNKCGGCQLFCLSYEKQLEFKRQTIADAMQRIGKVDIEPTIIGAENPLRYRNKMVFPFSPKGEWGFYRERSHDVVPLDDCLLGNEANAVIMEVISAHMKKFNIPAYDEESHTGVVRRVFTRSSESGILVVISANSDKLSGSEELCKRIKEAAPEVVGVVLNVNKKRTNLVLGDKNITLWGRPTLEAELCKMKYEVSPHSFFQVNAKQAERLYDTALELAQLDKSMRVLDVYCGIGTITLCAAQRAKEAIGVEIVPAAIEDAKKNAIENGVENVEFYCSSAEELVPKLLKEGLSPDVVILDPPRKGSDNKTLAAIAEAAPKRIVYVSCNPSTLARDTAFLTELGYKTEKCVGVDMFPYTTHVESVALLTLSTAI